MSIDEQVRGLIRSLPDYPQPGVTFRDITPVLGDGPALSAVISALAEPFRDAAITKVAGIEARGFLLAAPVAVALGAGFLPLRKSGKLPWQTHSRDYSLEYGIETLEVHIDAASPGDRVLIVDDVLATGGTAAAGIELVEATGAEVVGFACLLEIGILAGRSALPGREVSSIVTY